VLPELQQQFMHALLRDSKHLHKHLSDSRLNRDLQISIYQSSYYGGILSALSDIYPVTCKILGETFFNAMCRRYIKQTPCYSFDINQYGESFSTFANEFEPVNKLIYLPDIIRLEWAWHYAYQAADSSKQDFTPLLQLDSQQLASLHLLLHPTMSLLESPYRVDSIWLANQEDSNTDEIIDIDAGPSRLIIWRNGLDIHIDNIDKPLFDFLSISRFQTLATLQENDPLFEEHLATGMQRSYFHRYKSPVI